MEDTNLAQKTLQQKQQEEYPSPPPVPKNPNNQLTKASQTPPKLTQK